MTRDQKFMTLKTEASPLQITTKRQFEHNEDLMRQRSTERCQKAALRRDLQQQQIQNIVKREQERLYLPEKDLVTSGHLMRQLNVNTQSLEKTRNFEDTKKGAIKDIIYDDKAIKQEVRRLNEVGQIYRTIQ
jgi:hypothetical protein